MILIVDDELENRESLKAVLEKEGYKCLCAENGEMALNILNQNSEISLLISDLRMPGSLDGLELLKAARLARPEVHRLLVSAYGTIEETVEAMKTGAFNVLTKPLKVKIVLDLVSEKIGPASAQKKTFSRNPKASESWTQVLTRIERAANSNANVLLLGESGVGKSHIAKELHLKSPRANGPFVALNVASLAPELIESEIFGHEKGAYTGAVAPREGKVQSAEGGTLLLDEIADLSLNLQAKILQLIQERTYYRVGSDILKTANLRIIAATHKNLSYLVSQNLFREDLYYRLNVVEIFIPPLRDRKEDLLWLVPSLLLQITKRNQLAPVQLSPIAWSKIYDHSWPGNIRELENTLERTLVLSDPKDLRQGILNDVEVESSENSTTPEKPLRNLASLEKDAIERAMLLSGGNKKLAAKALGISERTLYRHLEKSESI